MVLKPINKNVLFYGDNLPILRSMPASSVDLIYLDPPFNSSRSYNVLFKDESGISSDAQITAFDDTWHWGPSAEQAYLDILEANPGVVDDLLAALRTIIGKNQMLAYLVMMAARLVEMHRVLKPTGSLYLHCDPTASHIFKIVLDTIFSPQIFGMKSPGKGHSLMEMWAGIMEILRISFFGIQKLMNIFGNQPYIPLSEKYIEKFYRFSDPDGRRWRSVSLKNPGFRPNLQYLYTALNGVTYKPHPNGWVWTNDRLRKADEAGMLVYPSVPEGALLYKQYLDTSPGVRISNIWDDIPPIGAQALERLGFPTQKPLALLERILQASSNPGDIVMDPFCGCGTAIAAAEKLGRQWIGIDITYLSINLIENRMKAMFPGIQFEVIGKPEDLGSARNLAQRDRYQFQWWALSLVGAKPLGGSELGGTGKKGSDKGIDGVINYINSAKQELKRVLVQVKSGHVNAGTIRDLIGTLNNEHAEIGVLITLDPPTRDMITAASTAGFCKSEFWQKTYPRLQILTIEQILAGSLVQMPPETGTFITAQKVKQAQGKQSQLNI